MEILKKVEEAVLILIKASDKGSYKKTEEGYSFEFGKEGKCIVDITLMGIDFKIRTIKWIQGNYEPIEGSELYNQILYEDLDNINNEEKVKKIASIISTINNS
ncbi:hypothetical protein JK636_16175 [Clostridium sp. YIM B02515]|uniref:Uncharacterized protein n=1 Tax=Clostridium rhizosphaerae TaxID=2803861 RepID=A0ABS1TF77_9CLOT|nr:hypothetical protein [Clostridium rhizosphaerae]MBL4937266.1 hypothetical protein [Clostridium rhizosphaerae]